MCLSISSPRGARMTMHAPRRNRPSWTQSSGATFMNGRNYGFTVWVVECQCRALCHGFFDLFERLLLSFSSHPCPAFLQESSQWSGLACKVFQKLAELVHHSQKPSNISHTPGSMELPNCCHFLRIWLDAFLVDPVAQECDPTLAC
jgi:hypothetical protein